ncbi:MAG: 3-hydroxybutyryl-CoA dehydrogenase [Deltaproteobacteria bacterium]|nr:3-hydroxybutyryl-CoA dehydrogenase [Deltaproteobacteria bacterium]
MEIKKIGIVAMTGFMGQGIAQLCAQVGYRVVGSSRSEQRLAASIEAIDGRLARSAAKGSITDQERKETMARILGTTSLKDFAGCDLVIESAVEIMDVKKRIFAELDTLCPKETILATNTSSLPVIEIAGATGRMDRVIGLHFLTPVPQSRLLEIVKTIATSDATLEAGRIFTRSLAKEMIISKDFPGFVFNRISVAFLLTAVRVLESGIATREEIDNSMKLGLDHPIGPLALLDFGGNDVYLHIANALYENLKDATYAPPMLLKQMVAAGWLGRKTGKGFYDYATRT